MTSPILTFIHISDTHIHVDPGFTGEFGHYSSRPVVAALIEHINSLPFPIDFVLHTGDVMMDPERVEDYALAYEMLSQIRYPVYYIPGNHDRAIGMRRVLMQDDGQPYYEFAVKGVQFLALDSSIPGSHTGRLSDEQLAWLDALCTKADDQRPLVVAVHHHPIYIGAPWFDQIPLTNGDDLHKILLKAKHRLRGVFFGHIHETTSILRDGITYTSTLSSWFQTRTWHGQTAPVGDPWQGTGFNVVTLTPTETIIRNYRVPGQF